MYNKINAHFYNVLERFVFFMAKLQFSKLYRTNERKKTLNIPWPIYRSVITVQLVAQCLFFCTTYNLSEPRKRTNSITNGANCNFASNCPIFQLFGLLMSTDKYWVKLMENWMVNAYWIKIISILYVVSGLSLTTDTVLQHEMRKLHDSVEWDVNTTNSS